VPESRSAVSGAVAATTAEWDFFRRDGEEDDAVVPDDLDDDADGVGVSDFRSFSSSVGAFPFDSAASVEPSAGTIVFGMRRFVPCTATVVLITPPPLGCFLELPGEEPPDEELPASDLSAGRSVSTNPDFRDPSAPRVEPI
jgi:hypothetical protein